MKRLAVSSLLLNCRAQKIPSVNERSGCPHQQYHKLSISLQKWQRPSCLRSPYASLLLVLTGFVSFGLPSLTLRKRAPIFARKRHAISSLVKAYISKHLPEHVEQKLENRVSRREPYDQAEEHRDYHIDRDKRDKSIFQTFLPVALLHFLTGRCLGQESCRWQITAVFVRPSWNL
jgi:hypothetical protein